MIFFVLIAAIIIIILLYIIYNINKEPLIDFDYINNSILENDRNIQPSVQSIPDDNNLKSVSYDNNKYIPKPVTTNDYIVLNSIKTGQALKRMHDNKNALVKKDWIKYFYTELKDNENSIWWEDHKPLQDPLSY